MTAARKAPDPAEEAFRLALQRGEPRRDWAYLAGLKKSMGELGWWLSLRDRGDGVHVDVCWFWKKDWRRTGLEHGLMGDEVATAFAAAVKGLSAPVPE